MVKLFAIKKTMIIGIEVCDISNIYRYHDKLFNIEFDIANAYVDILSIK